MGLKHLIQALREEDIEQRRVLRQGGRLRHRVDQEKTPAPASDDTVSTPDMGGRTFEDRQSAAAFSTLIGRGGLKGKVMEYVPPAPTSRQDLGQPARLRDRSAPEDRAVPGGVASKFGIRPIENKMLGNE